MFSERKIQRKTAIRKANSNERKTTEQISVFINENVVVNDQ